MANFSIMRYVEGDSIQRIDIEEELYDEILDAQQSILTTLNIEQHFGMIHGNYLDFEKALYAISFDYVNQPEFTWEFAVDAIFSLNRTITNMLSSFKIYLELVPIKLSKIKSKCKSIESDYKREVSRIYDSHLGYRVIYALRNHTHYGLPVVGIAQTNKLTETTAWTQACTITIPKMSMESLRKNERFKAAVLEDLAKISTLDEIDVRPVIRSGINGIGKINSFLGTILDDDVKRWEKSLSNALALFDAQADKAYLCASPGKNEAETINAIWLDPSRHRRRLQSIHRINRDMNRIFVATGMEIESHHPIDRTKPNPW